MTVLVDRWSRNPSDEMISVVIERGSVIRIRSASQSAAMHISHLPRLAEALNAALVEARLRGLLEPLPGHAPSA